LGVNEKISEPTTIAGYLAGTWKADPTKSTIAFSVRQLLVTPVRGRFTRHDITIVTDDDPLRSSVAVTIDLASADTGNPKRDAHLSSPTFLDAANHPSASYRSTGIRPANDGWIVDGELTLHGITRAVPLAVTRTTFGPQRVRFTATAQVKRGEFGIDRWTGGGAVVSDKVTVRLEIDAVRQA